MPNIKNIMMVFGTRPEAIKMAPLFHEFAKRPKSFNIKLCVTGQHREMLDQVLDVFNIIPDINLDIMKEHQDLFDISSSVLLSMRKILIKEKPDIVLVHGDTSTSFVTALACFYLNIPVGHVEAGLRTNNIYSPFPEEFNRQAISKISEWHFAPTENSRKNLLKEGFNNLKINVTGNTVIDALHFILKNIESNPSLKNEIIKTLNKELNFDWKDSQFILITGHRRENFGKGFDEICNAIKELANKYRNMQFIYPVHLNPNVQEPVKAILENLENVHLISPLEYKNFIYLLKNSYFVLTDSGGIQEEAPSLGKPVIVMRDDTERPEAVDAGTVLLSGADKDRIIHSVSNLIDNKDMFKKMSNSHNPYGDGTASLKIVNFFESL